MYCARCAEEFPDDEVQDCACGEPFCDECYELHFTHCPETLNAMLERAAMELSNTEKK